MTTTETNHVVAYLLTQMTYMLLARSPVKDALQKASEKHQNRLRASLTSEEYEPIGKMRDVVTELVHKLVNCQSVESLEHCYDYIKALNDGEVMIAVVDEQQGGIVGYERNR